MTSKRRVSLRVVAAVAVLATAAAACGSDKKTGTSSSLGSAPQTTGTPVKTGGSIVIGAEQWPDCLNPISQCANSSWLQWLVPIHVLPRLTELDAKNNFVASPLITELPSLANGDIKENPFTITYKLNPDAKWDDGTPITSADVKFSWQAVMKTKGSLSTVGYDQITDIDTSDPHTAVIHWKKVYSDWQDVLGGFSGVILEASKFNNNPETSKTMQTSYGFSGGPWILKSFTKQQEILVPNKNYWAKDRIPKLDQVTFVPRTDTNTEVQSLKSGEVSAIYPQPSSGNVPQLTGQANIKTNFGATTQYEALWFNEKAGHPFADKNVRAAFSYAFDRQKFLNDIVKPFDPQVQMLNCTAWLPSIGNWCDNTQYADVKPDPAKVDQFMKASGYAKDGSGIWAKGGQELKIKWMVNTGNQRREDTQQEFIPLLKKQGFAVSTDNSTADTVFQQRLPKGDYDLAMFIQVASPDPSVTSILACDSIPGPSNSGNGQNQWWWCNHAATKLMHDSDAELDPSKRADLIHQIGKAARDDYVNLPLYPFPAMVAWRSDKVDGPVDAFINSPESVLWNLWAWGVK